MVCERTEVMMASYGVIFDMDGVLVDSFRAHLASWQQMAATHGETMTEQQFAETFGRTSREIIATLWPHVPAGDIPTWDDEKEAAYRDILRADFPAMDGALELLASLKSAGLSLAIGSSGPPENVAVVLDCLGGESVFSATVDAMQVTHGKPDPEVFVKAATKLGIPPERCAVIEDAIAGVEAARAAGAATIGLTGTTPREKLAERAHAVVESLRELAPAGIVALIDEHAG